MLPGGDLIPVPPQFATSKVPETCLSWPAGEGDVPGWFLGYHRDRMLAAQAGRRRTRPTTPEDDPASLAALWPASTSRFEALAAYGTGSLPGAVQEPQGWATVQEVPTALGFALPASPYAWLPVTLPGGIPWLRMRALIEDAGKTALIWLPGGGAFVVSAWAGWLDVPSIQTSALVLVTSPQVGGTLRLLLENR